MLVCEGNALARIPRYHAAILEANAEHRMRVLELVKVRKQARTGKSYLLQRQAEDQALADFWDPSARMPSFFSANSGQ